MWCYCDSCDGLAFAGALLDVGQQLWGMQYRMRSQVCELLDNWAGKDKEHERG